MPALKLPSLKLPSLPTKTEPARVAATLAPQDAARELFREGLDALQHGDGQGAKPLLRQVLVLDPSHRYALSLLSQIDADPVEMLGKENFSYTVQPGDTLSLIAKRFLGDPFKFYVLARYNGVVISDNLEAGRSIRIPGEKPPAITSEKVVELPMASDTSDLRLSEARTLYRNGRFVDAINMLEQLRLEGGANAELDSFLVTVYVDYAKKLTDSGQSAEAKKQLSKALNLSPANEHLKKQIGQIDMFRNAEQTYQEGNHWLKAGEPVKAYAAYTRTLKLNPEHAGAKTALLQIKPRVVENYYADSVRARRRQKFAEALNNLDKLLEIEPNHELGKANRLEIKAILDREQSRSQRK
ncbi:MAG: LysM peptidoglycan-binding domain-containing protein [Nitrosospira sp.]